MGRFTKMFVVGTAAALLAAGSAMADFLLTNFDDGTNVSNIGTYFYYYSACSDHPLNQGPCKIADQPVLWEGRADDGQRYIGDPDEYGPFTYLGGPVGYGDKGKSAALTIKGLPQFDPEKDVVNGQPDKMPPGNSGKGYYPGFGFGILLTDDDDVGLDAFGGVTAVKFKLKLTASAAVKIGFKVEMIQNSWGWSGLPASNANPSDCYRKILTVTPGDWAEYTVRFTDLEQEGWGSGTYTFNAAQATKIAWYVNGNANPGLVGKDINVMIDDVEFLGTFSYTSPDICDGCDGAGFNVPALSKLLSDFEDEPYLKNKRNEYWYSYTDQVGGGNSSVGGLIPNPDVPGEMIMDVVNRGRTGQGNAAALEYDLGDPYKNTSGVTVEPFVGVGTNLFRPAQNDRYANAGPFTGIYFEYKTTAASWLDVELADKWDVTFAPNTQDRLGDLDGEVYYTRVKGTNGEWKSATVPFSKFVLPSWVKRGGKRRMAGADGTMIPLDIYQLAQLKFKVKGSGSGEIYIDNVYFYGGSDWGEPGAVKHVGSKAKVSGLRATYSRGVVGVNWSAAQPVASGKIQLLNTKGRVVASAPISASGSKVTASLSANTLPTGMYFVRMNAKDVKGAKIVQQSALSIVK